MASDGNVTGFEYRNKDTETPFETFLRYTDEKQKSSDRLATILPRDNHEVDILDIGTGNGEYLEFALSKAKDLKINHLTLLEPSRDLATPLKDRFHAILSDDKVTIVCKGLEEFSTIERFDIVLASHLFYHIPRALWSEQIVRMLSFLRPNGKLIIVLREKDDAYAFKMAFKPLLFDKDFKALVLEDVLAVMPNDQLKVVRYTAVSELEIPIGKNPEDTIAIIEFYLNKQWQEIPKTIQQRALDFIKAKDGVLKQIDGIAVIEKARP